MFRFEDSYYLYLLLLIPLLVIIRLVNHWRRRRRMRKMGDVQLIKQLMPDYSRIRPLTKFVLSLTAWGFLVVMIARPQFGLKVDTTKRSGIEAIICLDVSNSMMAEDVAPNRLERAKFLLSNIIDKMTDDKVGLNVFAGDAFTQLPITSDYVSAKMFLDAINTNMVRTQGTDIGAAIRLAMNSFTQKEKVGRAIILITDGENHEDGAEEAAKDAAKKGIRIFVLGIGGTQGAPIRLPDGSYLKDNEGNVVMTKLNEEMCQQLAAAGNGSYIHVDDSDLAQDQLSAGLNKLAKADINSTVYSEYDEQFQAFALIALVILVLEIIILERKNPLLRKLKLFKK